MAKRGGYRAGGGRPKGSKNRPKTADPTAAPTPVRSVLPSVPGGLLPLAYMLRVMNDELAAPERRDRMAIAAASFCHPRVAGTVGKRARAAEAAQTAGVGTDWGADLDDDAVEAVN